MSCLYALPTGNRFSQGLHFNEQQQLNVAVNACQLYSGALLKSKNTHGNMRSVFIQAGRSIQLQCMRVEHIYMLQAISSCASIDVQSFSDARGQLLDCTLSSARSLDAPFYMHDRGCRIFQAHPIPLCKPLSASKVWGDRQTPRVVQRLVDTLSQLLGLDRCPRPTHCFRCPLPHNFLSKHVFGCYANFQNTCQIDARSRSSHSPPFCMPLRTMYLVVSLFI